MTKGILTIACLLALTFTALPVEAQTRQRCVNGQRYEQRYGSRYGSRYGNRTYSGTRYDSRYYNNGYYNNGYYNNGYYYDGRSFWDRHRDKLTTAAGVGAGALLGSVVGGRKGAVIGAIAGGGGAALYTYKLRNRYRYPRY